MKSEHVWIPAFAMGLLLVVLFASGFIWQVSRAQEGMPGMERTPPASPREADLGVAGQSPSAITADIGGAFSYQGMLTGAGGTPLNGVCNFLFRLYDAQYGGNRVGGDSYAQQVPVTNGLFAAWVNGGGEFGIAPFQGQPRFLQVAVKCNADAAYTYLSPRQIIYGTPYALGLRPGTWIDSPAASTFIVENTSTLYPGLPVAIRGESSARQGRGVVGVNLYDGLSGGGAGVMGESQDKDSYGVRGKNSGGGIAVIGESSGGVGGDPSIGVKGIGISRGVVGEISHSGIGVLGENSGGYSGFYATIGVKGIGPDLGVWGQSNGGHAMLAEALDEADGIRIYAPEDKILIEGYRSDNVVRTFRVDADGEVYADGSFHPGGADVAEMLPAVQGLEAGDVLVIGEDGKLQRCTWPRQTSLAGVYSAKPGILGGAGDSVDLTGQAPLAVIGVVPVKVSAENGAIRPGDLLTTSATPGHAMKAKPILVNGETIYPSGVILGKALGSLAHGTGMIQVLIMLQ